MRPRAAVAHADPRRTIGICPNLADAGKIHSKSVSFTEKGYLLIREHGLQGDSCKSRQHASQ